MASWIFPAFTFAALFTGTMYAVGDRASRQSNPALLGGKVVTLPSGMRLYHGTPKKRGWKVPRGPAWFSEKESVAKKYSKGSGRVLAFDLPRDVELLKFMNTMEYSEATANAARTMGMSLDTPGHQVICAAGFSGWMFPDVYEPGSDIMLCDPSEFWGKDQ